MGDAAHNANSDLAATIRDNEELRTERRQVKAILRDTQARPYGEDTVVFEESDSE